MFHLLINLLILTICGTTVVTFLFIFMYEALLHRRYFTLYSALHMAYRKSGTQDTKAGPGTQDPEVGPYGGTLRWDLRWN